MSKIIEVMNQDLTYEARHKAFRKTLGFKDKHFTQEFGVIPFLWMSHKMWAKKILGGYRELIFGKGKKK